MLARGSGAVVHACVDPSFNWALTWLLGFERMDEDIVQTLTLSNGLLARNPDEKRAIPLEISFTRTPEPSVLPHKASTS